MASTLPEMLAKGRRKLEAKVPVMAANYNDAKPRAKENYAALPFGPRTKEAYNRSIDAAEYSTPDVGKWGRNWEAAVRR
ncbi:hypothetical protein ACFLXC_03220 [Chloroflexota bacterium]